MALFKKHFLVIADRQSQRALHKLGVLLRSSTCFFTTLFAFSCSGLLATENEAKIPEQTEPLSSRWQPAYLMQRGDYRKAIDLYLEAYKKSGSHDFELLEQMALILLEHGARSGDPQKQLISFFGARLAGVSSPLDLLEAGLKSHSAETQLACVHTLASLQDDRSDEILLQAMSSEFFPVRMDAGYYLAQRKHPKATGQIEALMQQVPPFVKFLFPQFFATLGTKEALFILRQLMTDQESSCRVEAILNAARFNRDDLLPAIRTRASHLHSAEQEASATALGMLHDDSSLPRLKKLSTAPSTSVRLAALRSLLEMGQSSAKEAIIEIVKTGDLFAIALAGELQIGQEELAVFLKNPDLQIRLNAAIALLQAHDVRACMPLMEILLTDSRGLGIVPQFSSGRSLISWKIVPSIDQQKRDFLDMPAVSLAVREHLLQETVELEQQAFLSIARAVFKRQQIELIPLLISLLENTRTPEAILLLQEQANKAGAPLIRTYCMLALFRLQAGPSEYEESLKQWLITHRKTDMIRFRPSLPMGVRPFSSVYELTAEEQSRLLVEICQALADRHDDKCLKLLIEAIRDGHSENRYALAGLLLRALQ